MLQKKHAALVAGMLLPALLAGLQTPASAARKRVSIKITKRTLRPTVLSPQGGNVTLAFVVTAKGASIVKVEAQAKLDKGATSALSHLTAGRRGLYSGLVNVPRNLLTRQNHASVYLIVTPGRGAAVKRLVGRVTVAAGDNSMPPPPPPK